MLNSAGVLQWSVQQGTPVTDVATCVAVDSSGDILVGGHTEPFGDDDPVLLKLNNAGALQWMMTTELATSGDDYIFGLTIDDSDHIFVTGEVGASFDSNTHYGNHDAFILKTDSAGTFQWSYQTGTALDDTGTGLGISNGDVYGAGHTTGSFPGHTNAGTNFDAFIVKLNAAGVQQWLRQITPATDTKELVNGLSVHPFWDRVAIFGSKGSYDFWAYEYDSSGVFQWAYTTGFPGEEVFHSGAYDVDGNLILAGRASGAVYGNSHSGANDFAAVKLTPPSSTTTTGTSTASISTTGTSSTTSSVSSTSHSSTMTSSSTTSISTTGTSSTTSSVSSTSHSSTMTLSTVTSSTTTSSSMTSSTMTSSTMTSSITSLTSTATVSFTSADPSSTTSATADPATSDQPADTPGRPDDTPGQPATTTTTSTGPLRLTRRELQTLEAQRQAEAAATVAKVQTAEAAAVAQPVPVPTVLGPLNATRLLVDELKGTRILQAEAANAFVVVSAQTVEEILLDNGLPREAPLLFSVLAMNETNGLQTDAILGEASVLSSAALSINVWRSDGTRIEVKDLVQPFRFTLEVTEPGLKCAFWDEDIARWSTDGLTTIASTSSRLACSTSHLTIFAGIKEVFLTNVVLALTCSTLSSLLSGPAFAKLQHAAWLSSTPSILNILFHGLGAVCLLLACLYDRKQERTIPCEEREVFLMQVKDDEVEAKHEDGDAPPPSRWTRCMGCCAHTMEYVSHASGGDATVEALKELAGNADTAAVNRAISTLQSHKARVARAQIAIFNKLQLQEVEEGPQPRRRTSWRSSISTAGDGAVAETLEKTVDFGQSAAQTFLQRGWLCRVATLWPASHPCLKAMHFSMLAPVRASVALLVLKITSAGALGAVFFSSSSVTPDPDPECSPPKGGVAQVVQSLTVGLITALLSDVIVSILFAMQVKKVVFSRTEWTERKKRRQRIRWSMWTLAFWLILLLYGGFCELYICLFLANVTDADRIEWLHSMGVALLNDLLLKSFLTAFILATIATLVLCCRPQVTEKIHAKWIKDGKEQGMTEHHSQEFELSNTEMGYFANLDIESLGGKSPAQSDVISDAFQASL